MMLHEDFEGIGAYLYELNDALPATLGSDIIAAMGKHVPIDLRPEIEEVIARDGVISRRDLLAKHGRIEGRTDAATSLIAVYNALGGGWDLRETRDAAPTPIASQ